MNIRALWHESPSQSILKNEIATPKDGQCLIEARYSLISTGTERLVASGNVPEDLKEAMAVPYMRGSFNLPLTYGYSTVGKVIDGPKEFLNKHVHLMHPHQDQFYAYPEDLFIIPDQIDLAKATLASNLETAVNAVWDGGISAGDKVLIVGFGIIGSLTAMLINQFPGVDLQIYDKDKNRLDSASKLGFNIVGKNNLENNTFDTAFNTSAHQEGLQMCIKSVGLEGKVIELSWYGTKTTTLNLGLDFHYLRKQIICSQVSRIPGNKQNRWNYKRRKELVFRLLEKPEFSNLVTHEIPFEETPEHFEHIRKQTNNHLSTIIKY